MREVRSEKEGTSESDATRKVNRAPLNLQNIWISSHEPRISICDHEDAWLKAWEYLPEFWCDKHVPSFQLSFFEDFS